MWVTSRCAYLSFAAVAFSRDDAVERHHRVERAVVAVVAEMYAAAETLTREDRVCHVLHRVQHTVQIRPRVAAVSEGAESDAFACPAFPSSHWKRLRTSNM